MSSSYVVPRICRAELTDRSRNCDYGRLIVLRHGESVYNREGRFTGWSDIGLSATGRLQCRSAADALADVQLDLVFTSDLERAKESSRIILERHDRGSVIEMHTTPALRGRNDGALVGLDKVATACQYGDELAPLWRRSFNLKLPGGESLADVVARVRVYFCAAIQPNLTAGKNILVVAHGNTIRALLVVLGDRTPETVTAVEIANGSIWTWTFQDGQKRALHVDFNS